MTLKKIKEIDGIGKVLFVRSKKTRRINITIKGKDAVRVAYPYYYSETKAFEFLLTRKNDIQKYLDKIQEHKVPQQIYKSGKIYKSRFHSITINHHDQDVFAFRPKENKTINIYIPDFLDILKDDAQSQIRDFFRDIYRFEAKSYLPERVHYFAEKYDFKVNQIFVKNQKSLWGSCSSRNNINLNLNLMRLPDELIDYVILHELVHTKIKNHSKHFWDTLASYIDNPKKLRNKINTYPLHNFTN